MTILSSYQQKINALRDLAKEMREFACTDDIPAKAKWTILNRFNSKIDADLQEVGLGTIHYPDYQFSDGTTKILNYINSLELLLGQKPVDISAGRE